ncbi:MAG: hypothetical protein A2Y79_03825 [Deltaproteobacteria bacterium RBG_13_43_22]|nr:MAG: hypothetical protein A2Y79_03825 [Deltaproteobacteria bacterium RBG_13_43_22]
MRILFVSTNRSRAALLPMPLGLASIIAQMDESRHEIHALDLMFCDQPEAELIRALARFEPQIIALSIRNLDNQSRLNTEYYLPLEKKFVELCRENSRATLIIGGAAFTVSPVAVFEYLEPDFGVIGEGETVFPKLVDRIEQSSKYTDLPGLVWRDAGGVQHNPYGFVTNLDALKPPRRDLFDNQRYAKERGMANIVVKQGCPFECLYCDGPHVMGKHWRMKSPQTVAAELESIQKDIGVNLVYFTDAIFNHPVDHAKAICQAIIDRELSIYWVATLHPGFVDRSLLELMKKAGCVSASPGCDTCSEKMLQVMRKGFTKDELKSCLIMLEEMEISYILSLLFGAPGENRETVEESIRFLEERKPMMLDFCPGIRLMPHTPLFDIAVSKGVISADDPLMEPKFYISPDIKDWIEEYLTEICSTHEKWNVNWKNNP